MTGEATVYADGGDGFKEVGTAIGGVVFDPKEHPQQDVASPRAAAARRFAETRKAAEADLKKAWTRWLMGGREPGDERTGEQVAADLKSEYRAKVDRAIEELREAMRCGPDSGDS